MSDQFISSDFLSDSEARFPLPELLKLNYFTRHRSGYYEAREAGLLDKFRNYVVLLEDLREIFEYNQDHARSFAKRLRNSEGEVRNCEAIFSEIIVYRSYIRAVYEEMVSKILLDEAEADIIIERLDGSRMFLEVFCVMPQFPDPPIDGFAVYDIKTHTQNEMSSVRQKLLRKITKQKQMCKERENFAVIELNDVSVAGDFAILSSLSGGYKLMIDVEKNRVHSQGYDWEQSIFEDPSTRTLKGVIYFSLGDYESRKYLFNPRFSKP